MRTSFDYLIVGGGLQGLLLALALRARRPAARVGLVERDDELAGNHTWSFHEGDVPEEARDWVLPLVGARWPAYEVRFPSLSRTVPQAYATVASSRAAAVARERIETGRGGAVLTGSAAVEVGPDHAVLANGDTLEAALVVDARGPQADATTAAGYQKFVGTELQLERTAGPERPLVMDATVAQEDGFRFVYVLPLARDRVLVEDTCFSDSPRLDAAGMRRRALEYADAAGFSPFAVAREEQGVLPLPWRGSLPRVSAPLVAGYRGGFFHPVTGYSFPLAVRLAALVASLPPERALGPELRRFVRRIRSQARFGHLLNWLSFRAYPPERRWRVLERFYREMPDATLRRFYALDLSWGDRARLLGGRPPRGLSLSRPWARAGAA